MIQVFHDPREYLIPAKSDVDRLRNLLTLTRLFEKANVRISRNLVASEKAEELTLQQRWMIWFRRLTYRELVDPTNESPPCTWTIGCQEQRLGSRVNELIDLLQAIIGVVATVDSKGCSSMLNAELAAILDDECYEIRSVNMSSLKDEALALARLEERGWSEFNCDLWRRHGREIGPLVENDVYYKARVRPVDEHMIGRLGTTIERCIRPAQVAAAPPPHTASPKGLGKPGRPMSTPEKCHDDEMMLRAWESARDHHVCMADFARERGITKRDLERAIDRARKRRKKNSTE